MGRYSILRVKSFEFALRIVKLSQYLKRDYNEQVLSRQVLRAGTAIGAMVREAEHASSKKDFLNKLTIGLKEANECIYWLELLNLSGYITAKMFDSIQADALELIKILISSIKTTKKNLGLVIND